MSKFNIVLDIIGASLLATVAFSYNIIFGVAVSVWTLCAIFRMHMYGEEEEKLDD